MKTKRSLVLVVALFATGLNAQASGGKKPEEKPKPRALRKVVELDTIKAKPILRQGQMAFDLQNAINLQAITAVIQSGKFTVKTKDAGTMMLNSAGGLQLMAANTRGMVLTDEEKCLASLPALRIGGEVIDFEFESEGGLRLGFSPKVDLDLGLGIEYKVKKSRMTSLFTASDASRTRILHSATTKQEHKESKVAVKVDFGEMANIGFDYYKQTPLAKVVERSLNDAMGSIAKATEKLQWEAPILIAERNAVAINAGFDAGIEVGDEFKVQNVMHYWEGKACESKYFGSRPDPDAIAIIQVYDVQATISWARVVRWNNSDAQIFPGARVQVEKLVAAPKKK